MKIRRYLTLIALCLFAFQIVSAQTSPSTRQIVAKVDEYMKAAVEYERFMGSILIAKDGKAIVSKGYGMANVEFDAPNNPNTVFRLASVGKQFTAAAIMILQERGKLNTSDLACKHLAQCPAAWQTITIHQLLTMTHGIPGINALEIGSLRGLPIPMDQWYEVTSKKPLEFTPGEKFKYLNAGFTVLGLIIEQISGKSYGEFMQENIFTPLGMKRTAYEDPLRIIKNRATGYKQLQGDSIANVPYREIIRFHASGGINSTTEDLLIWSNALFGGKLLSKKSLDEMFTPFRDMQPGRGYAYGLWSSQKFGRRRLAHGGNATGFINYTAYYPEDRVTVIVLSNNQSGSAGKINDVLSAITFGKEYELPRGRKAITVAPSVLEKYVGEYKFQYPETSYTITVENGKLMMFEPGYPKDEIFAESENEFFSKIFDVQIKFVKDANGKVTGVIAYQSDNTLFEVVEGKKVK
ncbi:MAG: serine hydrolase [Pyrinomonadaceae bacterium]|jgi:CubicO group peptidase (beta-lactamase class C family)|nr:serine hydrolase [Pyrinomonadaceae bacterium]